MQPLQICMYTKVEKVNMKKSNIFFTSDYCFAIPINIAAEIHKVGNFEIK